MEEEVSSGESDSDEYEEILQDLEALEHKAGRKRDNSKDVPPRKHEVSNGIFTACSGNASVCEPINAIGDDVGEGWWYHWTPITMRNTRKDTLAPLYRRIRGQAKQLAHNTNSLHSGRLTIKLAQGGRDAGEVWITFQSAANTVPCEHDFTRDCLTLGNRVVRLLSAVRVRRWLGRPTLAQEPARTKSLDVGHQTEAVKTKIWNQSWWRCKFCERTWGSRMLLGSANLNGTLPASSICLVRSALFPDGCMRISMLCSLGEMLLTLTARSSRRMQRAPSLHHPPPTARCSRIIRELMRATIIGFHVFALSGI